MIAQVRSLVVLLSVVLYIVSGTDAQAAATLICKAGMQCFSITGICQACWQPSGMGQGCMNTQQGVDGIGVCHASNACAMLPTAGPEVTCGGAPCIVDGVSVPDGETRPFYKAKKNGSCMSHDRTCTNGVLGPPHGQFYDYYSCNACDFNDVPVNNGSSVTAYSDPDSLTGLCTSELRQCVDGDLGGNLPNLSCVPSVPCNKAGLITWHPTDSKVKWCNGSIWKDPSLGTGTSCTGVTPGKISYVSGALHYCNGTNWISMKGASLGSCTETAGKFRFVTASSHFEYCDGSQKWKMGN